MGRSRFDGPIPGFEGKRSKHPLYSRWAAMWARCTSEKHIGWKSYGAKGVKVDPAWKDFAVFLRDMGSHPDPSYTIDRIDVSKGYGPENCRWATTAEQARNTTRNIRATVDGVTLTIRDWEIRKGVGKGTFQRRIDLGWPPEDAVSLPISPGKPLRTRSHCHAVGASE